MQGWWSRGPTLGCRGVWLVFSPSFFHQVVKLSEMGGGVGGGGGGQATSCREGQLERNGAQEFFMGIRVPA